MLTYGLAGILSVASIVGWALLFSRASARGALLPREPRAAVPWGFVDLSAAVLLFLLVPGLLQVAWTRMRGLDPEDMVPSAELLINYPELLAVGACGGIVGTVLAALWLRVRVNASLADLGIVLDRFRVDLGIGVAGFILLAPPVLLVQALLMLVWPESWEQQHPLVEALLESNDWRLFAAAVLAAVVQAPVCEEFLFRLCLQGWFEKLATSLPLLQSDPPTAGAVAQSWVLGDVDGVPAAPAASGETVSGWPVFASAFLFALAHLGHGPAPISLFVLAIGLGYLYHQTHRILPCLVVHLLVNASTMLQLWPG